MFTSSHTPQSEKKRGDVDWTMVLVPVYPPVTESTRSRTQKPIAARKPEKRGLL